MVAALPREKISCFFLSGVDRYAIIPIYVSQSMMVCTVHNYDGPGVNDRKK